MSDARDVLIPMIILLRCLGAKNVRRIGFGPYITETLTLRGVQNYYEIWDSLALEKIPRRWSERNLLARIVQRFLFGLRARSPLS
jgi:hypothetical protein